MKFKPFHEMEKIFFLILFLFIAVFFSQSVNAQTEAQRIELCSKAAGDANLLNSYPVQLLSARAGERAPVFRQAMLMKKGNRYRFTICTDEESEGEAVLLLYDEGKQIGSSYNSDTGRTYQSFDFDCNKTAPYILMITFREGKEGSAIGILSHVKTL